MSICIDRYEIREVDAAESIGGQPGEWMYSLLDPGGQWVHRGVGYSERRLAELSAGYQLERYRRDGAEVTGDAEALLLAPRVWSWG